MDFSKKLLTQKNFLTTNKNAFKIGKGCIELN